MAATYNLVKWNIMGILAVFNISLFAQNNLPTDLTSIKFEQINLEQGLSQSTVNAIVQDKFGFMWFGTQDGLNRYDGYSIITFKSDPEDFNSISDNRISCLLCDSRGDLWIGTMQGGVDRYVITDNKFYHNKLDENNSRTVSSNTIISLFEDSESNIWIGTERGLNKYDVTTGTFSSLSSGGDENLSLRKISINTMCEDDEKKLWIGTSEGLYKLNLLDVSDIKKYDQLNTNPATSYDEDVTSLFIDESGNLWVGTYGSTLKRYNELSDLFDNYPNTPQIIKAIQEDKAGNLWLGTSYSNLSVWGININGVNRSKFTITNEHVENFRVNTFYKDKSGILWIGTFSQGISIYDWHNNQFKHYLKDPFKPNDVKAILIDNDGDLWVGTNGNGLKLFDKQRTRVETFGIELTDKYSLSCSRIRALCESRDGSIWIGTTEGLFRFDKSSRLFFRYWMNGQNKRNGLSNNDITALYESSNGNLWIGNIAGGIDYYDKRKNLFTHYYAEKKSPKILGAKSVTVFQEQTDGSVLVGSLGSGLYRVHPDSGIIKTYQILPESLSRDAETDVNTSVNCIYKDEKNILWIGVYGNGLIRYDPVLKSSTVYTEGDGLPNDVVYGILPDSSGNLWLSTNKGISQFDPKTGVFNNFNVKDGLQSNEFNQGAYFVSLNGEMFFGGINGFNSFYPEEIVSNENIPPVYFTNFKVFDETIPFPNPIPKGEIIKLSYSQNFFSFEFVALNYTIPEKNQFAYILEGFDKNWHLVSAKQRYASYTNLNPGEYTLRVKGSNNSNKWNSEGTYITIIITPPFWMTLWFRGLLVLCILVIVAYIYNRRIKNLKREKVMQQEISKRIIEKQEEERSRISLEMHDVLGQDLLLIKNRLQLTLTSEKNNTTNSKKIQNISDDISKVLKTVRDISHNLRPPDLDQLGLTEAIQSLLQSVRNSTSIKVFGIIDCVDGLIPKDKEINLVRIIQEATGNIIKHSGATECRLDILKQIDKIIIEIKDNGKGFVVSANVNSAEKDSGLGLIGMSERVRILQGTFYIDSGAGKGTGIRIELPINK